MWEGGGDKTEKRDALELDAIGFRTGTEGGQAAEDLLQMRTLKQINCDK